MDGMTPLGPTASPAASGPPPATPAAKERISWGIVARAALIGLAVVVPVTIARVAIDREVGDVDASGWIYPLFVLILVGYVVAGVVAGRGRPDLALTHGTLAGVGVLVVWIPIRIVIWAVREDGRGLFAGHDAALRPGQVFGQLVIAAALGMLGGWLGARVRISRTAA